jgi:hypothetical protein
LDSETRLATLETLDSLSSNACLPPEAY